MNISTASWGWPQWVMLSLMFLGFILRAIQHGRPMEDKNGEPLRHNGFGALAHFLLWLFVLVAGGFFA